MKTRRELILDTVDDLVARFVYYDRKEDESLPVGAIEEALANDEILVSDMIDHFAAILTKALRG